MVNVLFEASYQHLTSDKMNFSQMKYIYFDNVNMKDIFLSESIICKYSLSIAILE